MVFRPVQEGQLKLGHPLQQVRVESALSHFRSHIGADFGNPGVSRVLLVGNQQVKLTVFLNLHTQLVQALDGSVAGKEVLGPGAEGNDFQVPDTDDGTGNGHKLLDHLHDVLRGAHGVLGDVGLQLAHT